MLRFAPLLLLTLLWSPGPLLAIDSEASAPEGWWERARAYTESAVDETRRWWAGGADRGAERRGEVLGRLDEILTLQDRHETLPESSWVGADQASNAQAIAELLDRAAEILVGDVEYRQRLRELAAAMDDNRRAIARLQRERIVAPSDSLWRRTVEDIEEEIAEREAVLADQQRELGRVRGELASELRRLGLDIDEAGLEFLLSTVVGDDVVDMAVAFEEVRALTEQLEALTAQSREDLPVARRYYGMYTVLLRVLERMHDNLIGGIDRRYLPQIRRIANRAGALRQETRALLARAPSPVLSANLEAQRLTLEAAERYADYLKEQRRRVAESRERLRRDLAVADNTYETVKVSGELVGLMKSSRTLIDRLFSLQVPRLRPFENLEMKREFERLTSELRTASGR
jgi:hypothetical protein